MILLSAGGWPERSRHLPGERGRGPQNYLDGGVLVLLVLLVVE